MPSWTPYAAALLAGAAATSGPAADPTPPNVVVIFIDDMGYADVGPFGCEAYPTPHLDRMATEGMVLTDFHSGAAVCSESRAALLTGCYGQRVGITGALQTWMKIGINADEITLAELCKSRGYATAIFGKWHLGCFPPFLPTRHGFDEWYGLPYSNDMWPQHGDYFAVSEGSAKSHRRHPNLPLYKNETIVDPIVLAEDQARLTTEYTEHAVDFIERSRDRPFFLYVPHSMVHIPLYVSEKFAGKSGRGIFGDVVMELDWSVGQILDALRRTGVDERTLVLFTSDNGPWLNHGDHAGSADPLREGKNTVWEGGHRVPTIARWPGRIPPGSRCDELATCLDLLPTVAGLIGAEVPDDRVIDGHDIWPLLRGDEVESPYDVFYCWQRGGLGAVRDRRWKLVLPHSYRSLEGRPGGTDGVPVPYAYVPIERSLYDLKNDVGETTNVAAENPDVVERLVAAAERAREELGDKFLKRVGTGARPPGRVASD